MQGQTQKNKALRKIRTMRYFIDAARDIIAAQGVEAVNIRDVATKAGYSSGSIYEYFVSIDELIAFATIDGIYDFLGEIAAHVTNETDPLEVYIMTWYFFSLHAFRQPNLYEKVIPIYGKNIVPFFQKYYELFPHERSDFPGQLIESFFALDRRARDHTMLLKCVEKGYFRQEDVEDISKMINAEFLGCIKFRCIEQDDFNSRLFIDMIKKTMLGYNAELAPVLNAIVMRDPY